MLPDSRGRNELGRYFAIAQVGLEMVIPLIIGLFVDARMGWSPWGMLTGVVLGYGGGLVHLIHLANKPEPPQPPPPGSEAS
jgi:F0F1-type ATP synthase assembly protein I